jgi:membrane-bound lytic murein transglycosylase D
MIFKILIVLLFSKSLFAFYYGDINKNLYKFDELLIIKNLDIDPNFVYDEKYNELKNKISQSEIHYFVKAIKTSPSIFNTLKDIVQKSNVPDNFLYLAMIESKFLISAKSNKNAAGLWQLMPKTAKLLKLKINKYVDERLDPIKSTKAALKYLEYLHNRFKKWYLAALAYNCGETRLAKAIKRSGSDDLFTLLDEDKKYLPKETQDYIRRLLISSLIARSKPIIKEINKHQKDKVKLESIKVKNREKLKNISTRFKIKYKLIKKYNSHIKREVVPSGYSVYIPKKDIKSPKDLATFTYIAKDDTTVLSLSKKLNIKFETIKALNKNLSIFIKKDEKILLPKSAKVTKKTLHFKQEKKKKKITQKKVKTMPYIIQKGDTIYSISKKFNNKIATIRKLNANLDSNLKAGMTIILKR